jgi:hypothetical protein
VKVFIDHNISPHIARALAVLAAVEGHRVRALSEDFDPATPDTKWLRRFGEEGGWVVISGDRRITRNPQEHSAWLRARVITSSAVWRTIFPAFPVVGPVGGDDPPPLSTRGL